MTTQSDMEARTLQIRRAHASARPKDSNPAWKNCHHDIAHLLAHIDVLLSAPSGAADKLDAARLTWIVHAGWDGLRKAWEKYGEDGAESELAEIRGVIDAARQIQGGING